MSVALSVAAPAHLMLISTGPLCFTFSVYVAVVSSHSSSASAVAAARFFIVYVGRDVAPVRMILSSTLGSVSLR